MDNSDTINYNSDTINYNIDLIIEDIDILIKDIDVEYNYLNEYNFILIFNYYVPYFVFNLIIYRELLNYIYLYLYWYSYKHDNFKIDICINNINKL